MSSLDRISSRWQASRWQVVAAALAFALGLAGCSPSDPKLGLTDVNGGARLAVIGASASAGYGNDVSLCEALALVWPEEIEDCANLAESRFFLDPIGYGGSQVEQAIQLGPDVVVAIDFLFWFGCGFVRTDREERLNEGLQMLDQLDATLLVGLIPDMRRAIGRALHPSQIPDEETLERLNAAIGAWAEARPNVMLVDLPELVGGLDESEFFQRDGLHPSLTGLVRLASILAETSFSKPLGLSASSIGALVDSLESARARRHQERREATLERIQGRRTLESAATGQ